MPRMQLTAGAPDEPDSGDWDALCATPGPNALIAALFSEFASGLPDAAPAAVADDGNHRVHTIWLGSEACGVRVTETESPVTTMLPMYCTWETFGLPGIKAIWDFKLDHAGPLGYVAFRHLALVCDFATLADQRRFAAIWQGVFGRIPAFDPVG